MPKRILPIVLAVLSFSVQAGIEYSKDGGQTWQPFQDTTSRNAPIQGIEPVAASGAACADTVIGATADSSSLQFQRRVPFANPGSNESKQTFLRFINPSDASIDVEVYGIDDDGTPNRSGPISFTLAPQASLQFTAQDMENGNTGKGLTNSFCDGTGKWQLIVRSSDSIEVMSLIRAPGGFLTSLNEVVPEDVSDRLVYFVNTASEPDQQTFLRILNRTDSSDTVTISGIDDAGNPADGTITFTLPANASQQMTSQDIENGNTGKGLTGAFGDGEGNWRLTVTSSLELDVMSLIRLPGGFLTNLSSVAPGSGNTRTLNYVESADETLRTGSIRVINTSGNSSTVTVSATDDNGVDAPGGDVTFTLDANAAREISVADLESGGSSLNGMLGDGDGRWRMIVSSNNSIEAMSLIETADGFLTNLSRTAPATGTVSEVLIFNPASNTTRRSTLRIGNDSNQQAAITISGFDDNGDPGDSDVTLNLTAGASIEITASDLENGSAGLGLVGALGDGSGKWRLTVTSTVAVEVMGTLDTPAGFISNLSRATVDESVEPLPVADSQTFYNENISSIIQGTCIVCHTATGVAAASALHYLPSNVSGFQESNYQTLANYAENNGETLLNRARGVSHGGGAILSSSSTEFENLSTFVDLVTGENNSSGNSGEFWEGVTSMSPSQTLRRASVLLRGSPPTTAEENAVNNGGEAALRSTIRGMMSGDGFHEFVTRGANDRLLTDGLFDSFFDAADLNQPFFPIGATWKYEAARAAGGEGELDYNYQQRWYWGLARAPIELIAYVVENDRNYQEVVNGRYMMVNYVSNEFLNAGASFSTDDPAEFQLGYNNGQILMDDRLSGEFELNFGQRIDSHGDFIDYPHAGVLNTHAFLSRYPSTETNRNRARARWTYYHFLGVDIEKSAERTTDPEALADTNNPTMNNPACTACHAVMDPVAGAFQNYGNEGFYRDQWGGLDSLPDTYKHPEWFEDGATSEYQEGDTWYRDMREPGFDGSLAPNPDNSIQWLGDQIAADERFGPATVRFWWPVLMGSEALAAPESSTDVDFATRLAAFEAQNEFIDELGASFSTGISGGAAYNARDLMTEMIMSPWFRAEQVSNATVSARLVPELGTGRLLTPEELEKKTESLLGYFWGDNQNVNLWDFDGRWSRLGDQYNIYYGGIDSNGITTRSDAMTAIMANVAEKQALEMACAAVLLDFDKANTERTLFRDIEPSLTPSTESSEEFDVPGDDPDAPQSFQFNANFAAGVKNVGISFTNDYYDEIEGDRNLRLYSLTITNPNGETVFSDRLNNVNNIDGANWGCGDPNNNDFAMWSGCTLFIPFTADVSGNYTITVEAYGDQAGPDPVMMRVAVNDTNPTAGNSAGAAQIKDKLAELHMMFLGEDLAINDPEIEATYQLLVETWLARLTTMETAGTWAWNWPDEGCNFPLSEHWDEGGVGGRSNDPTGMMNTWMSIIIYLMTDFAYLHE